MTEYLIAPPPIPSVAVRDSDKRFPVRRIFCVGRNYAEHAREMGNDPDREPPFFFSKPADALVADGAALPFPTMTQDLHYEAELVVAIGKAGREVAAADALGLVAGYAAGNDLTRRDLQAEAKSMRRPWDMAKGFDNSAACGAISTVETIGYPSQARITARVDGELRQDGDVNEMIWPVPDIIAHLSRLVALAPGDLIFTGTPAGVGAIRAGQSCTVEIEGLAPVTVRFTG
jgi:fumarylpyruvate hydrolase